MANSYNEQDYKQVYDALSVQMLNSSGIFEKVLSKFKEDFDDGGLSNDQMAMAKAQFYSSVYATLEAEANKGTISILKSISEEASVQANINLTEANINLTEKKENLVRRETTGFDDNLRIKKAEFNGNVAFAAINADSASAQNALDAFNNSISAI